jgi:hypothetical protein
MKDVAECFDMKNLHRVLINSETQYKNVIDYKYFACSELKVLDKNAGKKIVKDEIYLTYTGILRVLFNSLN